MSFALWFIGILVFLVVMHIVVTYRLHCPRRPLIPFALFLLSYKILSLIADDRIYVPGLEKWEAGAVVSGLLSGTLISTFWTIDKVISERRERKYLKSMTSNVEKEGESDE